jgi:hypothetical protein
MANGPKPGGACRGAVRPPNEAGPGGNRANHSYLPLAGTAGPDPFSHHSGGDCRKGSAPLGGLVCPVHPPDHRFDVGTAKMPQPPSAIEPGKGAIPVNPRDVAGRPDRAVTELEAERRPRR